jgi:hypothetical protein
VASAPTIANRLGSAAVAPEATCDGAGDPDPDNERIALADAAATEREADGAVTEPAA